MSFDELLSQAPALQITENAAKATRESVFVCIRGARADGHDFAPAAYANGCRRFVAERELDLPQDADVVQVPDTRRALADLACAHAHHPSHELAVVGITGTKGKTTTALLLSQILNANGVRCGYIGTNGADLGDGQLHVTANTTPDAVTLQNSLRRMAENGCRAVALEVSSQALKLERVAGTVFDTCIFTNLTPDHIGAAEHPDLADYIACKRALFSDYPAKAMLCNADDPLSEQFLAVARAPQRLTCSLEGNADLSAESIIPYRNETAFGTSFTLRFQSGDKLPCHLPLIGKGNVSDALLAMACAITRFGISAEDAARALSHAVIPGRSECIVLPGGAWAVIDYAHNGISLRNLLTELRAYSPNRLIVLFGSVGERTRGRRRELGEVAGELADLAILTSDNPGNEDPMRIIREIADGVSAFQTPYLEIPDRRDAIRQAFALLRPADLLVLAGKGHERYQLIGSEKIPFSERAILEELIQNTTIAANRV